MTDLRTQPKILRRSSAEAARRPVAQSWSNTHKYLSSSACASSSSIDTGRWAPARWQRYRKWLTPSVAADHIWAKCWRQPQVSEQYLLDCDSPISEAEAQAILEGYLKDQNLLPELRFWVANQGVTLNVSATFKRSLNAMLARRPAQAAP